MAKVERITDTAETEVSYMFDCPACGISHSFRVSSQQPGPPLWSFDGNLDKPTFQPSLKVQWGDVVNGQFSKLCHSFVRDGRIQFLSDCTHAMAGKTVELPDIEA